MIPNWPCLPLANCWMVGYHSIGCAPALNPSSAFSWPAGQLHLPYVFLRGSPYWQAAPPTSFSFSWTASQPANVQYLGQASPSACTAWMAVTEYGVESKPLASWSLRVLVGTSGYLQVLLVTCGYIYGYVWVAWGGYHLPPGVYRRQQLVIVQRLPSPNRIRLWERQRMWWRLIVVKWKRKDASQFTSFFTLEVERV